VHQNYPLLNCVDNELNIFEKRCYEKSFRFIIFPHQ